MSLFLFNIYFIYLCTVNELINNKKIIGNGKNFSDIR